MIGQKIFDSFFITLREWFETSFVEISDAIIPVFEVGLMIAIILIALSFYFGRWTDKAQKLIKLVFATIIAISFLEISTVYYWVLNPLLGLMIGFMQLLLDSPDTSTLGAAIFSGVDAQFIDIFAAMDSYEKKLEENGDWFSIISTKHIVLWLLTGLFGFLYAIFSILIIIGFFGFMLLFAFAPVFIVLAVFNKNLFLSWVKNLANYFLIPIFTAAVMSVTKFFLADAGTAIESMSVEDSIFNANIGMAFMVGVISVGLHWKAPEFAAGLTGGVVSGAGSIVGTAAAVAGAGLAMSKQGGNLSRGFLGGYGTGSSAAARVGDTGRQAINKYGNALYEKYRTGGKK